jgi:1-deoxy-D-xylulose-5-phosphate synthase
MGLYDIPYLLAVPNMIVTAPKDGAEMLALLRLGVEQQTGPFSLRYPRDNVPAPVPALADIPDIEMGSWEMLRKGQGIAILAVGTLVLPALQAAKELEGDGIDATVVNCRFLKPFDVAMLAEVADRHTAILTLEEGSDVNGFGAMIARALEGARTHPVVHVAGVPDRIIEHANRAEQLAECGIDVAGIAARVRALAGAARVPRVRETA